MDPLAVLTSAATVTTTARLGSSTLNATWCHPLLLGRTLTTLDQRAGENGPVAGWRHRRRCVVWE